VSDSKVSIIIPNYNRASLIGETIRSIKKQDYEDWECIIIDDHSTDNSIEVIKQNIKNDDRFRVFKRPFIRPKGANSCRNYGFEVSNGKLINWFDSDDLMTPDHISVLVKLIKDEGLDFAVGDSMNFIDGKGIVGKPYSFKRESSSIEPMNFARQSIGWITGDFLGKRELLRRISFNEKFKTDGDEYNFFLQLLFHSTRGVFSNKVLTYRRMHDENLSNLERNSKSALYHKIMSIKFLTFLDTRAYGVRETSTWFLSGYMQYAYKAARLKKWPPFFTKAFYYISRYMGKRKAIFFFISIFSTRIFNRGYFFLRKAIAKK